MAGEAFHNACRIMLNLDLDVLENAGVITPGANGGSDWKRYNQDPLMFIIKLPTERYERLWALIQSRQPEKYREAIA